MNLTVYLPDDIGKQGKDLGLNFSRLLREVVKEEIVRARVRMLEMQAHFGALDADGT